MEQLLILAKDLPEARRIAGLAGIGESCWGYIDRTDGKLRGTRGRVVLATSMDCWRSTRDTDTVLAIGHGLVIADCKVVPVPCPLEWERMGFRLPQDWAVPKSYEPKVILHPEKRLSWGTRLRQMFLNS